MVTRIFETSKLQTLLCQDLCELCRGRTYAGSLQHTTENLRAILVLYLFAHLLSRVFSHGVGNLVSEDNGQ